MHDRAGESAERRKQDGISHIGTKLGYPSDINIKGQQIIIAIINLERRGSKYCAFVVIHFHVGRAMVVHEGRA